MTTTAFAVLALAIVATGWGTTGRRRLFSRWARLADRRASEAARWVIGRLRPASREDGVAMLCAYLVSELRAGAAPGAALLAATSDSALVPRARTAALVGEPLAPALAEDARRAGSVPLAGVAACFAAAQESGAGLADGLVRVAALGRAQRRVTDDLAAETAAPRATARILSLLPLIGLGLGELLGAQPVAWLLGGPLGWACLAVGALFTMAGQLWVGAIMRAGLPRGGQGLS